MGLFSGIASIFFPQAAPYVALAEQLFSDDGGSRAAPGVYVPPPPPQPLFTGVGASSLNGDEFGGDLLFDEQLFEDQYGGDILFDEGFSWPGSSTAPPVSVIPQVVRDIAGSVLGAVVPSAEAGVLGDIWKAVTGSTAATVATVAGGAAVAGGVIRGAAALSNIVASAIFKLRARLTGLSTTISGTALGAYGARIWGQITGWVQKNPGTSAIAMLTGLGLTVEEAAHFLAWGATKKRRARARGISGANLRTTRRTIRKITSMSRSLAQMCRSVPHHARKRA